MTDGAPTKGCGICGAEVPRLDVGELERWRVWRVRKGFAHDTDRRGVRYPIAAGEHFVFCGDCSDLLRAEKYRPLMGRFTAMWAAASGRDLPAQYRDRMVNEFIGWLMRLRDHADALSYDEWRARYGA